MSVIAALDMASLEPALRGAIGRSRTGRDVITPRLVEAFRATIQDDDAEAQTGDPAPLAIHWCLAPATTRISDLGPDGHTAHGDFLPEIPLERRMWAGGRLTFHDTLRVGDTVERVSRIADVTVKQGRSGTLCFVAIDHEVATGRGPALTERQDLVFRAAEGPRGATPEPAPAAEWRHAGTTDPVLLFRYSALTFNGHRIHYDQPYVTGVEHYPGLIVHGPLQATLLLDFAARIHGAPPRRFGFRAMSPLFAGEPYALGAASREAAAGERRLDLWVGREDGGMTMRAEASW